MSMSVSGVLELVDILRDVQTRYVDDVVYVTGTSVEYAVYLETGTENMQPYPFLFPAMRDVARAWDKYGDADELNSTEAFVKTIAFDIEAQAKKNVAAATSQDRSRDTHPAHPRVQTDTLRASIKAERIR